MAKKSRDAGASRAPALSRPQGGLRNAGVVKTTLGTNYYSAVYDIRRSDLLEDWDTSAFDVSDSLATSRESVDRYDLARPSTAIANRQGRNRDAEPARSSQRLPLKRLALPQVKRQPGAPNNLQARKQNTVPATQSLTARRDHLQAKPSEKRKENSRANCKQRPEPVKSGGGSGRAFVPWCDRKR